MKHKIKKIIMDEKSVRQKRKKSDIETNKKNNEEDPDATIEDIESENEKQQNAKNQNGKNQQTSKNEDNDDNEPALKFQKLNDDDTEEGKKFCFWN